jgi:hypothetical protein
VEPEATEVNLREPPIRSKKYLNGARGETCKAAFPGICNNDPETVVFAHLNGAAFGKGKGQKAHDIAGLDACSACHAYVDVGHDTKPQMSEGEFYWHLLRGVVLTMLNRARRQIIVVPLDPEHLSHDKPTRPRKPKAERQAIPHRKTEWPSRPMRSANNLRRKPAVLFKEE